MLSIMTLGIVVSFPRYLGLCYLVDSRRCNIALSRVGAILPLSEVHLPRATNSSDALLAWEIYCHVVLDPVLYHHIWRSRHPSQPMQTSLTVWMVLYPSLT